MTMLSSPAYAQASIAGAVRDTSGAVLPGVTVEAASPALIEKTRTVVTDGTGQYRVENLRPGTYTVTYALAGFSTVKRDGIELTGNFTATVNAELRVGALEETVTVTGETPLVDVQGTTRQQVLDDAVIDTLPAGRANRGVYTLGVLIPGVSPGGRGQVQDVGGSSSGANGFSLVVHGSQTSDSRITQNGVSLGEMSGSGFFNLVGVNMAATKETTIDTSAVSAEQATGGVRINLIPKDGGNSYEGTFYGAFANQNMQGTNLTQALKDAGLVPATLRKTWDINPGFGGPLRKDKVWFYLAAMYDGNSTDAGIYRNLNANNPNVWTYAPDLSRPASNDLVWHDGQLRLTWQATPKHKLGLMWHEVSNCYCPNGISATTAPDGEGSSWVRFPVQRHVAGDWTAPITNRLLVEVAAVRGTHVQVNDPLRGTNPAMIAVTEQSTGLKYRSGDLGYRASRNQPLHMRSAVSYITGAHALKVGINHSSGWSAQHQFALNPITYRFNNGVPNELTQAAYPSDFRTNIDHDLGLFAQDKWTIQRFTASYGVRFDWFKVSYPVQRLGPTMFTPARDLTFPAQDSVSLRDLTPKLGAAYDLFGDGKTALKVTLNKYLKGMGTSELAAASNPVNTIVTQTTRAWNDANRNFIPDCDLTLPAANGECGAMAAQDFGTTRPGAATDPDLLAGWGKRFYNWEFSTSIQHELFPRVSVDVGYFRRWNGNFIVTDNTLVDPSDYTQFGITAPVDPRLPGGGGYALTGLYDVNPNKFGQSRNFVTFGDNYGKMTDHWNGVDGIVNARPRNGLLVQGGFSSGRRAVDFCNVIAKLPEVLFGGFSSPFPISALATVGYEGARGTITPAQFCHQSSGFLTQVKALTSYTIPKVDVLVSAALQNLPGPSIRALYTATNAVVSPALGRNLSGNTANLTVAVVSPDSMYGDRINQLDLRFGKVLRFNRTRTTVSLDLYNALNANSALTLNERFAVWQRPTAILPARLAKLGVQFEF
jgi:hypothetical protein